MTIDPTAAPDVRRIGLPGSPGATRVMLLGSGESAGELAIAFQRLGVEVVAVDRADGATAHRVAHRQLTVDPADADALYELIAREPPQFVVPEIDALAAEALERVEAEGLARIIPTARAVSLTRNRERIRRLAAEELGVPTSRFGFASSAGELREVCDEIGYPCLVKSVLPSSGRGRITLHSGDDAPGAWQHATADGRTDPQRVIVESVVEFEYEITLLTVRSVDPDSGEIVTRFCEPIGHRQADGDRVESWQPQMMTQDAYDSARSVSARVTRGLGGVGVFGVELFVCGPDVYFSEVSPHPPNTGFVTVRSQVLSAFEMHARAVLGLPVVTTMSSPGASTVIYGGRDTGTVAFEGAARALSVPESDLHLFGTPHATGRRRMGVALATAEDVDTARERAREAAEAVRVVD